MGGGSRSGPRSRVARLPCHLLFRGVYSACLASGRPATERHAAIRSPSTVPRPRLEGTPEHLISVPRPWPRRRREAAGPGYSNARICACICACALGLAGNGAYPRCDRGAPAAGGQPRRSAYTETATAPGPPWAIYLLTLKVSTMNSYLMRMRMTGPEPLDAGSTFNWDQFNKIEELRNPGTFRTVFFWSLRL